MPRSIINHLRSQGGALDFADTKTLLAERDAEWDSEVPQIYFNRVEKAIKGLTRAAIKLEVILHQGFRECISNLVFGVNREYFDKAHVRMFAKMMTTNVYLLSPWV